MTNDNNGGEALRRILVSPPTCIPRSLLVDYLDRRRNELVRLKATSASPDFEFARIHGHQMKGTGGAYGVPAVTAAGAAIEQAAIHKDADALGLAVASLESFLNLVEVAPD